MPPTLTSKNIFDVVFELLPADSFIETGPATLKEELMLEAAGMLGSNGSGTAGQRGAQQAGSSAVNRTNGGAGATSYRRHLLSSAFVAATAAMVRSIGSSASAAVPEDLPGAVTPGERRHAPPPEADILDGENLEDMPSSPYSAEAAAPPPPAYAAVPSASVGVLSGSLFRRVDDEVDAPGVSHLTWEHQRSRRAQARRDGDGDATEVERAFDMQMDTEDDAVREATKYASYVAEMQAVEEAHTGQQGRFSQQPVGGGGPLDPRGAHSGVRVTGAGIELGTSVGDGSGGSCNSHVGGDAAAAKMATAPKAISVADELTMATASGGLMAGGASSAAVSGARSQAGGVVHSGLSADRSATGVPLPQQPFALSTGAPQRGGTLTAAEQLARMPPGLDHVYTGACVMYRHQKSFGFVSPDIGGPDVYFVSDSIALSFTKLALRAFYLRNGMPVPQSIAAAYRLGAAKESTAAPVEDRTPIDGTSRGVVDAATSSNANSTTLAQVSSPTSAITGVTAEVSVAGEGQAEVGGAVPAQHGALGVTPGLAPPLEGMSDRVSIPPTTAEELAWAEKAASLLTTATAQLLQYQCEQGIGGGIRVGDRLSFVVTRNHAGRGGSGRLLRAEFIRGVPAVELAMPLEQSWFYPLFPGAIGRKTHTPYGAPSMPAPPPFSSPSSLSGEGGGAPVPPTANSLASLPSASPTLARYTGCVRTYDAEEQRGYICCDESGGNAGGNSAPDVIFHTHSVLWDLARCPPPKRKVKEGMRLAYSVCGTERNGKYIATLITTPDGEPFCEENMTFAENVLPFFMPEASGVGRRRGRGEEGGGVGSSHAVMGMDTGTGPGAEGAGGDRKRVKAAEDDMLLLYAEDDYPFM
ncbi:hypothetical protein JKF63_07530 [Porcisia hertigi]|uniref:Uncharacterized protein n=1 Tax=Porcisia hertigi TaxID=2761500 RepID=A0A836LHA6_9TRYP|nr:hypothetical protein JKF63_07530 [Porcisia hertigi]